METVHFYISGRVQGVGFRRFVVRQAAQNHLSGWVKNTSDSRVEVVAAGETKDVVPFLSACQRGPLFARVLDVHFVVDETLPEVQGKDFVVLR